MGTTGMRAARSVTAIRGATMGTEVGMWAARERMRPCSADPKCLSHRRGHFFHRHHPLPRRSRRLRRPRASLEGEEGSKWLVVWMGNLGRLSLSRQPV